MIKLYDILKSQKTGLSDSLFTAMLAKKLSKPVETVKELTDTPPLSFTANGEPLIDWSISGASGGVGNKTANLYKDDNVITIPVGDRYGVILPPGTYSIRNDTDNAVIDGINDFQNRHVACEAHSTSTVNLATTEGTTCGFVMALDDASLNGVTIVSGSTPPTKYIPYGYEISVTCGGETNTIYLDAPLGASDSISMTDTSISIPTVDGSNTLSVGTTVQPSSVYIKYKE